MKTRILLSVATILLLAFVLLSCSDDRRSPSVTAFPTTPKFLIAVDGSGAGTNVNVFPIGATTGVLGAAVTGSPFDLGLTAGMTLVNRAFYFAFFAESWPFILLQDPLRETSKASSHPARPVARCPN